MRASIYRITRRSTDQTYIGISVNPRKRRNTHFWIAKKRPQRLVSLIHKAIAKYGRDEFLFEELACAPNYESGLIIEALLIEQWAAHVDFGGYNLTLGGVGKSGWKCPDSVKKKISAARAGQAGRAITEVEKAASRERLKSMSPEQKLEMARRSMVARRENGKMGYGRKNSPETIQKMKAAAVARWARERSPNPLRIQQHHG